MVKIICAMVLLLVPVFVSNVAISKENRTETSENDCLVDCADIDCADGRNAFDYTLFFGQYDLELETVPLAECTIRALNQKDGKAVVERKYADFAWSMLEHLLMNSDQNPNFLKNFHEPGQDAIHFASEVNPTCENRNRQEYQQFLNPVWDKAPGELMLKPRHLRGNPVWDQNGNKVTYEVIVLNDRLQMHLSQGGNTSPGDIYASVSNQVETLLSASKTSKGNSGLRVIGWGLKEAPIEEAPDIRLRLAWKTIAENDDRQSFIINPADPSKGLVAMNASLKVRSAGPYWLWLSFGHVNNVAGASPYFNNPKCNAADCPPNVCPQRGEDNKYRTQIKREVDLSPVVKAINEVKHQEYGQNVLKNYQLIGVQWPEFKGKAYENKLAVSTSIEGVVVVKDDKERADVTAYMEDIKVAVTKTELAGLSAPLMSNEILEWDFQNSNCLACHSRAVNWAPIDENLSLDEFKYFKKTDFYYCDDNGIKSASDETKINNVCVNGPEDKLHRLSLCLGPIEGQSWCRFSPNRIKPRTTPLEAMPASDFFWQYHSITDL
jgi:hypothetical protein